MRVLWLLAIAAAFSLTASPEAQAAGLTCGAPPAMPQALRDEARAKHPVMRVVVQQLYDIGLKETSIALCETKIEACPSDRFGWADLEIPAEYWGYSAEGLKALRLRLADKDSALRKQKISACISGPS